jgi:hypothetical protein
MQCDVFDYVHDTGAVFPGFLRDVEEFLARIREGLCGIGVTIKQPRLPPNMAMPPFTTPQKTCETDTLAYVRHESIQTTFRFQHSTFFSDVRRPSVSRPVVALSIKPSHARSAITQCGSSECGCTFGRHPEAFYKKQKLPAAVNDRAVILIDKHTH